MSSVVLHDISTAPRDNARLRTEYTALTQRAGMIIQPDPGILRVDGRDRVDWLHNLVTTDVEVMQEGSAAYSLLLDAKAHVLADFVLVKQAEYFLLYTSTAAHENLFVNLHRAIFREKVTLTDVSEQFGIISVQGLQAARCLSQSLDLSISESLHSALTAQNLIVIPNPRIPNRFDVLAPHGAVPDLNRALAMNGAAPIGLDALNIVRVEAGIPQYGDDFDETTLAPEARLDEFIAPSKGCYPGQETIARIRNLGHVNRLLAQLLISNNELPQRDDKIFADEKEIGDITSAVWSFARNAPLALGYTRREYAVAGTRVQIARDNMRLDVSVFIPSP